MLAASVCAKVYVVVCQISLLAIGDHCKILLHF